MVDCEWNGCDREFDSTHGMRIHHSQTHGESIAGEAVDCAWCGETNFRKQSQIDKKDNIFCDRDCQYDWQSENFQGKDNPSYDGSRVETECAWCGEGLERAEWEVKRVEHTFCRNTDCRSNWMAEHHSGENHPSWDGGKVKCECHWCGDIVHRIQAEVDQYDYQFCSSECIGKWHREQRSGEDSPLWTDDPTPSYYGASWQRQRSLARERDEYECEHCGVGEEKHKEVFDTELNVHHIIPFKHFEEHERANHLSNLVTLCRDCHYNHERWADVVASHVSV